MLLEGNQQRTSKSKPFTLSYPAFESSRTSLGALCIFVASMGTIGAEVTRMTACVAITYESGMTWAT